MTVLPYGELGSSGDCRFPTSYCVMVSPSDLSALWYHLHRAQE